MDGYFDFLRDMQATIAALNDEPYKEYWKELGRFIHNFSQTESRLISLLRKIIGTSDIISGVLVGSARIDGAKDILNRILEATNLTSLKTLLERPLAQFSAVATVRNNLVHW
jgi:hypothetical protein